MDNVTLNARVQHKHALEVQWSESDFVPLLGEIIVYDSEVDFEGNVLAHPQDREPIAYARSKIGDGKRLAKDLPFMVGEVTATAITDSEIDEICSVSFDDVLEKIAVEGEYF